jgi:hypothetical protein
MINGFFPGDEPGRDHLIVGALVLELASEWDAWVSRRVDSFVFAGDDERELHRHQSLDFQVPSHLWEVKSPLLREIGGFPVPVTFIRKWRLAQFNLREESGASVSLLQREQSVRISAAMLIALGTFVKTGKLRLDESGYLEMPEPLRRRLATIPGSEPTEALMRCVRLSEPLDPAAGHEAEAWRQALARDETFMSLAYELAEGFLVMAAVRQDERLPRCVLKFSFNSYVSTAPRDGVRAYFSHLGRRVRRLARDAVDPVEWARPARRRRLDGVGPDPSTAGRLIFSTLCEEAPEGLNRPASSLTAALATIEGPRVRKLIPFAPFPRLRRRQTVRLRPSGVVSMDGLPPGDYTIRLRPQSGYELSDERFVFTIAAGEISRLSLRTRHVKLSNYVTRAPATLSSPAPLGKAIIRGLGWRSKPLAIRVRAGEGGSYHCEFEAPAGLHITRARLVSNLDGNADGRVDDPRVDGVDRPHDVDLVLKSTQRAHLYAPAGGTGPATAYAVMNLRPRRETIVRPALITGVAAAAVLVFIGLVANSLDSESAGEPTELPWTFFALLLAGPGALAAYISQAVGSRVTNAMLWGLRLLALVPTILSLAGVGALFLSKRLNGPELGLWIPCVVTGLSAAMLAITYRVTEHSPEQKLSDYRQGRHFESRYAARPFGQATAPAPAAHREYVDAPGVDSAVTIRDQMLERIGGMTHATRRVVLGERSLNFWELEVPPALFFDSADSPAAFRGLATQEMALLRLNVRSLIENLPDAEAVANATR